jgi:hypothetical protein
MLACSPATRTPVRIWSRAPTTKRTRPVKQGGLFLYRGLMLVLVWSLGLKSMSWPGRFDTNCENLPRLSFFAVAGTRADELARERRTPLCVLGL